MKPQAVMLAAVPLVLAGLGWWGSGSLVSKLVKPQPAPTVTQITLPPGIELLAPTGPRPPLGYLELGAFGFTKPPKIVVAKPSVPLPVVPVASDIFVVDSVLLGNHPETATIGNRVVKVGDKLDDTYTVVAIARDGVWVRGQANREEEKIGFRALDATPVKPVAEVSELPSNKSLPAGPVTPPPDNLRDFRQLLEMLKL